jgi:AcrR family transcriptional regulator
VPSRRRISRELIIDTSRKLFRVQGYNGTTLDQVATELGVTRAALYHWYPSKQSVLCEIHEAVMDDLMQATHRILELGGNDVEKLESLLRNHVVTVAENLDAITVFFQDESSLPQIQAQGIAAKKRSYNHLLEGLIERAQSKGHIRPDLDPKIGVNALMGMCNWLYQWYDPTGPASAQAIADQVVKIAMAGIVGDQLTPPLAKVTVP